MPVGDGAVRHDPAGGVPVLRRLGLATDRPSTVMRGADGTIVEHVEWVDRQAIDVAHEHPEVPAIPAAPRRLLHLRHARRSAARRRAVSRVRVPRVLPIRHASPIPAGADHHHPAHALDRISR